MMTAQQKFIRFSAEFILPKVNIPLSELACACVCMCVCVGVQKAENTKNGGGKGKGRNFFEIVDVERMR